MKNFRDYIVEARLQMLQSERLVEGLFSNKNDAVPVWQRKTAPNKTEFLRWMRLVDENPSEMIKKMFSERDKLVKICADYAIDRYPRETLMVAHKNLNDDDIARISKNYKLRIIDDESTLKVFNDFSPKLLTALFAENVNNKTFIYKILGSAQFKALHKVEQKTLSKMYSFIESSKGVFSNVDELLGKIDAVH